MDLITKLEKEIAHLKQLKIRKKQLEEENKHLEEVLRKTIPFYSASLFAHNFNRSWNEEKIRKADNRMTVYCLTHSIEIRRNEEGIKSYPYTAWRDLGYL